MKKYGIFAALLCLLCFWMTACGVSRAESDNLQESSLTIQKDGSILNVIVESFGQDYYSVEGLSDMIQTNIEDYVSRHAFASITLQSAALILDDSCVRVELQYDSADTYAAFNGVFFFYGTVEEALNQGYLASRLFYDVKDGAILQITNENVENYKNLHICITEENMNLYTFGDILYVDSDSKVQAKRLASFQDSGQNHIVIFK